MTAQTLAPSFVTATVDVRRVALRDRHPLIFSAFNGMAAGQALVLVNDHDPMWLYDQLQAARPGGFDWDYLERGPVWRVLISKIDAPTAPHGNSSCCGACGGA
ncbi:MAG: DUF2249 domain-containing protein [Rubrivivax sp.]|nr:MAG: DUF2249 domain-containing protein [Rubrivivax sp.]